MAATLIFGGVAALFSAMVLSGLVPFTVGSALAVSYRRCGWISVTIEDVGALLGGDRGAR